MERYYYELRVKPSSHAELFGDFLIEESGEGIEELDNALILRSASDPAPLIPKLEQLKEIITERIGEKIELAIDLQKKENIDWIEQYRASITPITCGEFHIYPSWYPPKEQMINIEIDPALAFGSGHHESTRLCLERIGNYVNAGDMVADIGCGSGILGIAAAKKGAKVYGYDTDPGAIDESKKNAKLNSVSFEELSTEPFDRRCPGFDMIIANIVTDVLIALKKGFHECLRENGLLILSGILAHHQYRIEDTFGDFELVEWAQDGEWLGFVYRKTDQST